MVFLYMAPEMQTPQPAGTPDARGGILNADAVRNAAAALAYFNVGASPQTRRPGFERALHH